MPVDAGDCEGVLLANELVGSLLPFTSEVAIGEMVAVKALVDSTVGAVEDGEGGRGKRPICTSLGARPVAALTELL